MGNNVYAQGGPTLRQVRKKLLKMVSLETGACFKLPERDAALSLPEQKPAMPFANFAGL